MESRKHRIMRIAEWSVLILILVLYPLRHVNCGVDLWDGGYNYANFRYSGLEYMDPMWYFATLLANAVGSLFTKLPFGGTYLFMNIYTGLVVSAMAVAAFFFGVKQLKMPAILAFLAEMTALSLCWAPTAMLYSYLTYAFLLAATILLYRGILEEKAGLLAGAGVVLGFNVGNRFSNLVQTGLILAVWIYGMIGHKKFKEILRQTLFCMAGYFGALAVLLGGISLRFGLNNYIEGILRLFGMTEHAEDYTPGRMLLGMVWAYYDCTYFLKRFALALVAGLLICVILPKGWQHAKKIAVILVTAALCAWLSQHLFYTKDFAAYNSMYYPCVTCLTFTLCLSLYYAANRKAAGGERLLGILLILTILITSLGGNNAIYSSINNLFLVLPGALYLLWHFCRDRKHILYFPFQSILAVAFLILLIQGTRFGMNYVYEEASGARELTETIREIPVLSGMKTSRGKAEALTGLYRYLQENELADRKCILYGQIPGIAYAMELAPAMNIWSDLRSYDFAVMQRDLEAVEERPLIVFTAACARYVTDRDGTELFWDPMAEEKMRLLCTYIEENDYKMAFSNGMYAIYE